MTSTESIWFHSIDYNDNYMKVNINLKPSGKDALYVEIPKELKDCILAIAQLAADEHEQKVKAVILSTEYIDKLNTHKEKEEGSKDE